MRKYLDEQYSFNALQSVVQNAVNRELTETEVRYLKWLAKYDCETIETFAGLFEDASIKNSSAKT